MNYDFKANWNDIIVPLLSLPKVKRSVKRGIIKFIESGNGWMNERYDSKRCPASYGRGDGWSMDLEEFENTLTKKFCHHLITEVSLPLKIVRVKYKSFYRIKFSILVLKMFKF